MIDALPGIILACTLRGTLLIAIAMLAGPWARRFFGRNGAHWLWLAVLPALLWPLPPHTPLSLRALWGPKQIPPVVMPVPDLAGLGARDASDSESPLVRVRHLDTVAPAVVPPPVVDESAGPAPAVAPSPLVGGWGPWLVGLWLAGVGVSLAQLCWRWHRTAVLLRDARPVRDERASAILGRFVNPERIGLAVTSRVRAPALAGIWWPRILIPEGWLRELSMAELESVLLHELGHHRRGDLIWEWLYAVARCLHWMNPAVRLAEHLARQERELACDAWALERTDSPEEYGEALLAALKRMQHGPVATFGVVTMAANARQIARRLEWIGRDCSVPRWLVRVAWVPALLALLAVGSDPVGAQAPGATAPAPSAAAAPHAPTVPAASDSQPPLAEVALADEPLPLAKRSVDLRIRILRMPEEMARELGWPIAEEESKGVERILSREEYRRALAKLRAVRDGEIIPGPRQSLRNGQDGSFEAVRAFRYGDDYKAAPGGILVPSSIETVNLGLTVSWRATIQDEQTAHLDLDGRLARLIGFAEEGGKLSKLPPSPPGTDWVHRLVACQMPVGTAGTPTFSQQYVDFHQALSMAQVAIVLGYRDLDRLPAPGATREQTMVNYIAVQIEIAP